MGTVLSFLKSPKKITLIVLLVITTMYVVYMLSKRGLTLFTHPIARKISAEHIGKEAKPFCLEDLSGNKICLNDFKGKPVLLVFWAPWCPHCINEIDTLKRIHTELKDDIVVLSVVLLAKKDAVMKAVAKQRINYPVLFDKKKELVKKYKIRSLPLNYFIDKNGTITNVIVGEDDLTVEEVREMLNRESIE